LGGDEPIVKPTTLQVGFIFVWGVVDGKYYKGGCIMLFVALYSPKPGTTPAQSLERRMKWNPPQGMKKIAEYWLANNKPHIIVAFEADNYGAIMGTNMPWADLMDFSVFPAITGEEGIKLASQMMPKT
jgi:hypothetical protein